MSYLSITCLRAQQTAYGWSITIPMSGVDNDTSSCDREEEREEFDGKGVSMSRGQQRRQDAIARSFRCFEKAVELAKAHSEVWYSAV